MKFLLVAVANSCRNVYLLQPAQISLPLNLLTVFYKPSIVILNLWNQILGRNMQESWNRQVVGIVLRQQRGREQRAHLSERNDLLSSSIARNLRSATISCHLKDIIISSAFNFTQQCIIVLENNPSLLVFWDQINRVSNSNRTVVTENPLFNLTE